MHCWLKFRKHNWGTFEQRYLGGSFWRGYYYISHCKNCSRVKVELVGS